jgi:hypothetical protein
MLRNFQIKIAKFDKSRLRISRKLIFCAKFRIAKFRTHGVADTIEILIIISLKGH